MKIPTLILVALFAVVTCDIKEEENVLVLTNDNFDKAIEDHEHILVEFYAPWCEYCKAFAPEYERTAALLKERGSHIVLAKVDVPSANELGHKYKINHIPALKFFRHGEEWPLQYNGPRHAESLVAWLEKKSGPPSVQTHSVDEINRLLEINGVIVLGFFKESSSSAYHAYLEAADEMVDILYLHTHDDVLFSHYKISEDNAVVLLKNFDHGRDDFAEQFTPKEIKKFVKFNRLGVVVEFDLKISQTVFEQELVKEYVVLFTNCSDESFPKLKEDFKSVAYKNRGKYVFVIINLEALAFMNVFKFFSVDYKEGTTMRYINMTTDDIIKYKYEGNDYSAIEISNFIQGIEQRMLQRFMKTEALPDDWDALPVKVLTRQNFDEVTLDETKAVFVEFYSPLCYNCKALHPVFDKLAEHYKDNADIVIAKTNAYDNEYPQFNIKSYPVIKYFPKGGKQVIDYTSDMLDLDELINFIDHDGHPPTKKFVTSEELAARRAEQEALKKENIANEKDSEEFEKESNREEL